MRVRFPRIASVFACVVSLALPLAAQSPNGNINGRVVDPSNGVIAGADVVVVNDVTGMKYSTQTNSEGIYVLPTLPPGPYRLQVSKPGFKTLIKPDITLNVQDALSINFTLPIGALYETVTVEGGAPLVNTESASVSTVVDRQFAENLPMNGRSFQTLIQLTPGVVLSTSNGEDPGQFSVNGQRASANYWMVDGVSANIGSSAFRPNGAGGSVASFSALGGTNSLVSVDALQEFRIQTSTYAPEFGRTPGAQISIVTRSGTNRFHGTLFDYFRNDVLDSNNWFADHAGLSKPEERQNDFGGTFDGPIFKDRTFFFFSYEGLRLRLPQVAQDTVPDLAARQSSLPIMQPYLDAYPVPNGPDLGNGIAELNASYSNPATLDTYSLRVDHRLNDKLELFARYNYSPSSTGSRGAGGSDALSEMFTTRIATQTFTVGGTSNVSSMAVNETRFNYSATDAKSNFRLDNFAGAVPLALLPFPSSFTSANAWFSFEPLSLTGSTLDVGDNGANLQRQINVVDNVSLQKGSHTLKFGVDFRRLSPEVKPSEYAQIVLFADVPSAAAGNVLLSATRSHQGTTILFHNLGLFAQDTWRMASRLTLTYGLRWDIDFVPSFVDGPSLPAVTGFNLLDLSDLALAPSGTPAFSTTYRNVAPRVGLAYQIRQDQNWQTVLRGGFGVFYDLATSEVGNLVGNGTYPYGVNALNFGGSFPLSAFAAAPPPITVPGEGSGTVTALDPHLQMPYTLQWNAALEQAFGGQQRLSLSYIGSAGRRLLQTVDISAPNANYAQAVLVGNTATSGYNALQVQFQRRLSRGLQALASYTWSHSIDTASAGSYGNFANTYVPGLSASANRGDSDFDVRNAFAGGLTYDLPPVKSNSIVNVLLSDWSTENVIQARSASPVDVFDSQFTNSEQLNGAYMLVRPDVVPEENLYLFGSTYPGGKALNPAAFVAPPTGANGAPLRQGDLARNALRGFGAFQWDFAVHRGFPIRDSLKLEFRAEMFNLLNHPNFGPPVSDIQQPNFGLSTETLGQSLSGGGQYVGAGAYSPLYQIGGPRSIQLALKMMF